jgi:hypothetical protein
VLARWNKLFAFPAFILTTMPIAWMHAASESLLIRNPWHTPKCQRLALPGEDSWCNRRLTIGIITARGTCRTSEANFLTGARVLSIGISAATGTCFAVLAGLSISAMVVPVRRFHVASIVLAAVAICLGWMAFRAAMAHVTEEETEETEETVVAPLLHGMVGAFVGLIFIVALLLMFGADARGFLAHALGKPTSSFTPLRLLAAAVLLGFGTGFVIRVPSATKQPPTTGNMTGT